MTRDGRKTSELAGIAERAGLGMQVLYENGSCRTVDDDDLGRLTTKLAVAELDETVHGGAALAELESKSLRDIQQETAYTWTWRAWARYRKARAAKSSEERVKWLLEAEECAHEGKEHAALVGGGSVLRDVERILASAQK
jgi:hypothetical protein